ncbi:MAG: flagellar motor protein MotB [Thermoleophilia bacterium]|nr:flagellar motor protein MotB [Thermoleophilia bacterium]
MSSRRNRRGGGGEGGGEERWLLPYADMITLLLGLFIVLFALSSIDAKKFDGVSAALSKTFKGQIVHNPGAITAGSSGVLAAKTAADSEFAKPRNEAASITVGSFSAEKSKLDKMKRDAEKQLGGRVDVRTDSRGLVVSIAGDALFDSGSDQLKPRARETLTKLAMELKRFNRDVEIQGHTDGAYIHSGKFTDNMTLSFYRAYSVWELMTSAGFPGIRATPVPRADNDPVVKPKYPTENVPANRRVEIHVLAPGSNDAGLLDEQGKVVAPKGGGDASAAEPIDIRPKVQIAPPKLPTPAPSAAAGITDPILNAS